MILHCKEKAFLHHFLRVFSGLVARQILGAEKANSKIKNKKFWDFRPYSRVLRRLKDMNSSESAQRHFNDIGFPGIKILAHWNSS
jgi:hypothetical protein